MKNKIYSNLPGLIFSVLVICFLVGFYVFAWTEPTAVPPGGNVPAPLNVSINAQSKEGALVVGTNSSIVTNPACSPNCAGLIVQYGNVGIGTTNPQATLDIGTGAHGSPRFQVSQATNSFPRLYMGGSSATVSYVVNKINPVTTGYFGEAADTGGYQFRGTGSFYIQGNVGIGTTSPTAKLEVNGDIRAKNGILMAGTVNITAYSPDPDAGITDPIDVSSFGFSSANDYQVLLTPQTPLNGAAAQHPCFGAITDINGGCFGPLFWPVIANKTATSFRIIVHDNINADIPGLIVPVDYIVVKY